MSNVDEMLALYQSGKVPGVGPAAQPQPAQPAAQRSAPRAEAQFDRYGNVVAPATSTSVVNAIDRGLLRGAAIVNRTGANIISMLPFTDGVEKRMRQRAQDFDEYAAALPETQGGKAVAAESIAEAGPMMIPYLSAGGPLGFAALGAIERKHEGLGAMATGAATNYAMGRLMPVFEKGTAKVIGWVPRAVGAVVPELKPVANAIQPVFSKAAAAGAAGATAGATTLAMDAITNPEQMNRDPGAAISRAGAQAVLWGTVAATRHIPGRRGRTQRVAETSDERRVQDLGREIFALENARLMAESAKGTRQVHENLLTPEDRSYVFSGKTRGSRIIDLDSINSRLERARELQRVLRGDPKPEPPAAPDPQPEPSPRQRVMDQPDQPPNVRGAVEADPVEFDRSVAEQVQSLRERRLFIRNSIAANRAQRAELEQKLFEARNGPLPGARAAAPEGQGKGKKGKKGAAAAPPASPDTLESRIKALDEQHQALRNNLGEIGTQIGRLQQGAQNAAQRAYEAQAAQPPTARGVQIGPAHDAAGNTIDRKPILEAEFEMVPEAPQAPEAPPPVRALPAPETPRPALPVAGEPGVPPSAQQVPLPGGAVMGEPAVPIRPENYARARQFVLEQATIVDPQGLVEHLGISPAEAQAIHQRLIADGLVFPETPGLTIPDGGAETALGRQIRAEQLAASRAAQYPLPRPGVPPPPPAGYLPAPEAPPPVRGQEPPSAAPPAVPEPVPPPAPPAAPAVAAVPVPQAIPVRPPTAVVPKTGAPKPNTGTKGAAVPQPAAPAPAPEAPKAVAPPPVRTAGQAERPSAVGTVLVAKTEIGDFPPGTRLTIVGQTGPRKLTLQAENGAKTEFIVDPQNLGKHFDVAKPPSRTVWEDTPAATVVDRNYLDKVPEYPKTIEFHDARGNVLHRERIENPADWFKKIGEIAKRFTNKIDDIAQVRVQSDAGTKKAFPVTEKTKNPLLQKMAAYREAQKVAAPEEPVVEAPVEPPPPVRGAQ